MSIKSFGEFLDSHADVAQKVASCSTFDEVSAIAKANGFEVTGAELTQHAATATSELSDESLEAVAGGAWRRPSLALFQELQSLLPMLTFLTSTDGCIIANRVRPNPLIEHSLQESKRMLPLATLFASTDCCTECDPIRLQAAPQHVS